MSDQQKTPTDYQSGAGLAAALSRKGLSVSQQAEELMSQGVSKSHALAIAEDYAGEASRARSTAKSNLLFYTLMWFLLVFVVGIIASVKGYGMEYIMPIPLVLAGVYMAFRWGTYK